MKLIDKEYPAAKTNILSRCQIGFKLLKPDLEFHTNVLQCQTKLALKSANLLNITEYYLKFFYYI